MGTASLSDLEIAVLAPDAALAFGRWQQQGDRGTGSGLFTLLLRKTADGWRIVHDHTSVAVTQEK
jgi:ketosteroid isomerase-like protein